MNLRNLIKVPTAVSRKQHFAKPSIHCTTNDYFNYKIALSREVAANEDVTVDASMFVRLTPLLKPAFANATFEHRAFFVPYRTILENFNELVTDTRDKEGVIPQIVGNIKPTALLYWLCDQDSLRTNRMVESIVTDIDAVKAGGYDICYPCYIDTNDVLANWEYLDSGTMMFLRLTQFGKFVLNTLTSLGYNLPYRVPVELLDNVFSNWRIPNVRNTCVVADYELAQQSPEQGGDVFDCRPVSTLPICAALKVYRDWYQSPRITPTYQGHYIDKVISYIASTTFDAETMTNDDKSNLIAAFGFMFRLYYDNDYFTSAQAEYLDQNGSFTAVTLNDTSRIVPNAATGTEGGSVVANSANGSITPTIFSQENITYYLIQSLNALTKWMRRNNIAGSRTLDRYLAHYGVQLSAEKLKRSTYLGKFDTKVDVQAIMANASTTDTILGDYAGAGIGGSSGKFHVNTDEFGQLLIISVCKPEVAYYQGIKKELFHLNRYDFFQGEFDNLGYQAVSNAEVSNSFPYSAPRLSTPDGYTRDFASYDFMPVEPDGIHGFQPRYMEYKCSAGMQDVLSGDFRIHSSGAESYDFFHQFRTVVQMSNWSNNANFQSVIDRNQYDRIFSNTDTMFDHFICFYNFKVDSYLPAMNPFDSLDFADDMHNSGQTVDMNLGGTKF